MATGTTYWAAPNQLKLEGNFSENYQKFDEHWALFEKAELKGKLAKERCSYFLLCIGERGREVHKTLTFPTAESEAGEDGTLVWKRTTAQLRTAFKAYYNPRTNITYERKKCNIRNQAEDETIDQYVTVLCTLAATCEFQTLLDGLIRDRIVYGIRNQSLKERLFRETDLTLAKAIDICRAAEVSREQLKSLSEKTPANVDAVCKAMQNLKLREEHDRNLENVLNRVSQINVKLSKEKCQFRQTEITYLSERLTQQGVQPDLDKIKAISDYLKPEN